MREIEQHVEYGLMPPHIEEDGIHGNSGKGFQNVCKQSHRSISVTAHFAILSTYLKLAARNTQVAMFAMQCSITSITVTNCWQNQKMKLTKLSHTSRDALEL